MKFTSYVCNICFILVCVSPFAPFYFIVYFFGFTEIALEINLDISIEFSMNFFQFLSTTWFSYSYPGVLEPLVANDILQNQRATIYGGLLMNFRIV